MVLGVYECELFEFVIGKVIFGPFGLVLESTRGHFLVIWRYMEENYDFQVDEFK